MLISSQETWQVVLGYMVSAKPSISLDWSIRCVVDNVLDCDIIESEFEIQPPYYVRLSSAVGSCIIEEKKGEISFFVKKNDTKYDP